MRRALIVAAVAVVAVVALGGAGTWYLTREDPGVTACKAWQHGSAFDGDKPADRYDQIRGQFQDSSDDALKTAGTKFTDVAWQWRQARDNSDSPAAGLVFMGSAASAYSDMAGACGAHGVKLKPLGS